MDTLDDGDVAAEVGKLLTQLLGKAVPPPDTVHRYAWTKDEYTLVSIGDNEGYSASK